MNSIDSSNSTQKQELNSIACDESTVKAESATSSAQDSISDPSRTVASGTRTVTRWSLNEDQNLRMLVKQHGPCKWKDIAVEFSSLPGMPTRSCVQCLHRWNKCLKPGLVKGSWSREEDEIIKYARERQNKVGWSAIADLLPGRLGKQVRERWINHLDPSLVKRGWTPEEDQFLYNMRKHHGNKWKLISKHLPGRSENGVKNRWHSIKPNLAKRMAQWAKQKAIRARVAAAMTPTSPQVSQMQSVSASATVPTDLRLCSAATVNPSNLIPTTGQIQHVYHVSAPNICTNQSTQNQPVHPPNSIFPQHQTNNQHMVINGIPIHQQVNARHQVMAVSRCQVNPQRNTSQIARRDSHSSCDSAMSGHSVNVGTGQTPALVLSPSVQSQPISSHDVQSQPTTTISNPSTYVIAYQQHGNAIYEKWQYAAPVVIQSPHYSTLASQHGVSVVAANPQLQHQLNPTQMFIVPQAALLLR